MAVLDYSRPAGYVSMPRAPGQFLADTIRVSSPGPGGDHASADRALLDAWESVRESLVAYHGMPLSAPTALENATDDHLTAAENRFEAMPASTLRGISLKLAYILRFASDSGDVAKAIMSGATISHDLLTDPEDWTVYLLVDLIGDVEKMIERTGSDSSHALDTVDPVARQILNFEIEDEETITDDELEARLAEKEQLINSLAERRGGASLARDKLKVLVPRLHWNVATPEGDTDDHRDIRLAESALRDLCDE